MKYVILILLAVSLSGCANGWQKVNCGWTDRVLPIKPSRADKLTKDTFNQVLAANQAQKKNCR